MNAEPLYGALTELLPLEGRAIDVIAAAVLTMFASQGDPRQLSPEQLQASEVNGRRLLDGYASNAVKREADKRVAAEKNARQRQAQFVTEMRELVPPYMRRRG